jgi:RNA polymerase sigma-70 factor (ECF subfamily)
MADEPIDASEAPPVAGGRSATEPALGSPGSQPEAELAADKVARDLEFSLFYTEQMPRLVAFLIVQGARPSTAAEVAQEAMTEAYRQWDRLDTPRAWIRTVASRTWWRRIDQARAEDIRDDLGAQASTAAVAAFDEIENRYAFLAILRSLHPGQQQVMAWIYDGYQPTEIAAMLRIPPATVRSRLRDARAALRKAIGSDEETP